MTTCAYDPQGSLNACEHLLFPILIGESTTIRPYVGVCKLNLR